RALREPAHRAGRGRRRPVAAHRAQRRHPPARPAEPRRHLGGAGAAGLGFAPARRPRGELRPVTRADRSTASAAAVRRVPQAFPLPSLARCESWVLVVLALITCSVSGGMLWVLGINYDGLTGSAVQK